MAKLMAYLESDCLSVTYMWAYLEIELTNFANAAISSG